MPNIFNDGVFSVESMAAIIISILLGLIISVTYMKTEENEGYSQHFMFTLVIIPAVVAIIIILIGSNVARAFTLAGTFSLVRFRSNPGSPKSIAYIFFTMAAGLACGAKAFVYAFVFSIMLCFLMFILTKVNFGKPSSYSKILKIVIPENLDYEDVFDDILSQYTNKYTLLKVRTADLGSVYELVYSISIKANISQKEFIDKIRCRNGNLNITLIMDSKKEDF